MLCLLSVQMMVTIPEYAVYIFPHWLELVFLSCHPLEDVDSVDVANDCLHVTHLDVGELSKVM